MSIQENHSWSLIKIHARPCIVTYIYKLPGERLQSEMAKFVDGTEGTQGCKSS